MKNSCELLIIGGGAAGMAAALSARKTGVRDIILIERADRLGGILPQCIHNGFGLGYFHADMTGPEYAEKFIDLMRETDIKVWLNTNVLSLSADKTALVSAFGEIKTVGFERLILAAGCRERPIGALPVCGTRPAGIFTAGCAQKLVNLGNYDIGREIVILGSGDIGMIMARRFTLLGKHVAAMVEQASELGGMPRNRKSCIEAYNIPVMLSSTVEEIHGDGRISGVTVRRMDGEKLHIPCDTLITAVGLIPERELTDGFCESGRLPDWIKLCGNCDYIHEIVDTVTVQAEKTGAEAFGR